MIIQMTYDQAAYYLASRIDEIDIETAERYDGPEGAVKLADARDIILKSKADPND